MDRRQFMELAPLSALTLGSFGQSAKANQALPPSESADNIERYRLAKFGIFVHLVPELTIAADGFPCRNVEELANNFDVRAFCRTISSFKPDYLAFTAWHFRSLPLYPSAVNAKWRQGRTSATRDLVGEIIHCMNDYGIPVILYTHPRDGHDFTETDMISTGWGAGGTSTSPDPNPQTFKFDVWNQYIADLYNELMHRYGDKILGVYLDEGSGRGDSYKVVDYYRIRRIIKGNISNNKPVMIHNWAGNLYSADVGNREYYYLDQFNDNTGTSWPSNVQLGVSPVVGSVWYATKRPSEWTVRFSPEALYRYTVLQASANLGGGGVAWSAGPYASGKIWETGVEHLLRQAGELVERRRLSISGTLPSMAYPTADRASFGSLAWGVACESSDRRTIYLHVLKPPSGNRLQIPGPVNGVKLSTATELLSGREIRMLTGVDHVIFELPDNMRWDPLDTVIRVSLG